MNRWGLIILVASLFCGAAMRDGVDRWVGRTVLPGVIPATSVEVRDRNNQLLRAYTIDDGKWRLAVDAKQVDPAFMRMLIAYEDKRFLTHHGIDIWAVARAAGQSLVAGEIVSGGSTLTMQVARLLEQSGTGALRGKLRQMRVALALERRLDKQEILQLYLELAPYGGNIEGIRAASLIYFGKEPKRLTPAQAALLVALPQSPEARRPDRDPNAAIAARSRVLQRAQRAGVISAEALTTAQTARMPDRRLDFPALAPHLADRALRDMPDALAHKLTIDGGLQQKLEILARQSVRRIGQRVSVAMVVADHSTGAILASVGSAGYGTDDLRQGFVDMTQAKRSPGSTLKPLVYALAFDRGLAHPETLIEDRPVTFGRYAPQNFDGQFRGTLRIADALQQSLNIPVVKLTNALGPAHLMAGLQRAGTAPKLPSGKAGLAVALGGVGINLTELVQLYAGLANGGRARHLYWREGAVATSAAQIVGRVSAWQVGHILAGIAPPPGAGQMRLAYKTGTSYGHRDAWSIGFDGLHVVGVWIGRPDGTPVPGAFGGELAAPVLFEVFTRLKAQVDTLPPPPPETLLLSGSDLPRPLQNFREIKDGAGGDADAPNLTFPPDGARMAMMDGQITVKLRGGTPPFTWLANGAPLLVQSYAQETQLPILKPGFLSLSVIDGAGRAARANIRVD